MAKSIPVLFELYEGKIFLGYVEKEHCGPKPWGAHHGGNDDEIGAFRTRRGAEAALRQHAKKYR
jgi:hypothetical protein